MRPCTVWCSLCATVVARHPILASVSENMVTSESNNTKGYVTATVRLGGTGPAVRFVCTHLDSRNDHSRRAQVLPCPQPCACMGMSCLVGW